MEHQRKVISIESARETRKVTRENRKRKPPKKTVYVPRAPKAAGYTQDRMIQVRLNNRQTPTLREDFDRWLEVRNNPTISDVIRWLVSDMIYSERESPFD